MSYDPNIAAAKRLARRMSRDGGASHQSALEEIARASGRADWAAFIADPVPPLEPRADGASKGRSAPPVAAPPTPSSAASAPALEIFLFRPLAFTLAGLAAAAAIMLAPMREETAWIFVVGATLATGLLVAAVALSLTFGLLAFRGRGLATGWMPRGVALTGVVAILQGIVGAGAVWGMTRAPEWRVSVPGDVSAMVEEDRMNSRHVRFDRWDRDTPVASIRPRAGGDPEIVIAPIDDRLRPARRDAPLHVGDRLGGKAMASALAVHPVFRIRGDLSCSTGVFTPRRFEAADSYRSPAAVVHPYDRAGSRRGFDMRRADASTICAVAAGGGKG